MSEVDREQVRHVARLARLEFSDDEIERLTEELGRVLSRFRELEAAEDGDAGGGAGQGPAAAMSGGADDTEEAGGSGLRPDRPDADWLARGPGELAPEWEDGFFLVPRLEAIGGREAGSREAGDAGRAGGNDG